MKIAFCSCNHPKVQPRQLGWLALAKQRPDVLLLLGDNVYIEDTPIEVLKPRWPSTQLSPLGFAQRLHARYRMQALMPEFQAAVGSAGSVMGTIDDHDFLGNDQYVQEATQPQARFARQLHRQFVAYCNQRPLAAAYPPLDEALDSGDPGFSQGLGVASSLQQGQAKLMLLDNRSYRQSPKLAGAVALGAAQTNWLAQELLGSQRLCIVASGSTLSPGSKQGIRGSPLADYPYEAQLLRNLYRHRPQQVVLHLGGDLHYNQLWHGDASHLGFTEVASSGMGTGWQPFAARCNDNYGLITLDPQGVQLQLHGRDAQRNAHLSLPWPV